MQRDGLPINSGRWLGIPDFSTALRLYRSALVGCGLWLGIGAFALANDQGALGLTVPAMPLGSPGMAYNNQFTPYETLVLKKDGTVEVYAAVNAYAQQFD